MVPSGPSGWRAGLFGLLFSLPEPASSRLASGRTQPKANLFCTRSLCLLPGCGFSINLGINRVSIQSNPSPGLQPSHRGCQNSRLLPPKMRQGLRQLTLPQRSLFVGGCSGSLPVISCLNLIISLRSRYYHYPRFIEKNTKEQRGSVTSKVGLRASPVAQQ